MKISEPLSESAVRSKFPKLVMMIGLPGSGKSTLALELSDKSDFIIHSSDKIREELYGNESEQGEGTEVFEILHRRIKQDLLAGKQVIMDATNLSSKHRRAFLQELPNIPCHKIAHLVLTPFTECCRKNNLRNRIVPMKIMDRMYKNFTPPAYWEGFDVICLIYNKEEYPDYDAEKWINAACLVPHDNPHHQLSIGEHCKKALEEANINNFFNYSANFEIATILHDCGKPYTKAFTNSKGEISKVAHYYSHQNVGAYDSLFFTNNQIGVVDPLEVSQLICYHMHPFFWEGNEKSENKFRKLWGENFYNKIIRLHECDLAAH